MKNNLETERTHTHKKSEMIVDVTTNNQQKMRKKKSR